MNPVVSPMSSAPCRGHDRFVDVDAAFHYVRSGATVRPDGLPDRATLEALVRPG